MSPNSFGALLMMASMASFTLNDTLIKMTDGAVPLGQMLFLRGALSVALILIFARWLGRISFAIGRADWSRIAVRSGAEIGAAYFFISALLNMPIANVTAILQALPLTVAVAAAVFLGEPLGWRRMVAIGVGLVGVLLIVRPGAEGFSVWSLYALGAVACVTVRDLATRRLSVSVPTMTVTLMAAVTITLFFGAVSITEPWVALTPRLSVLIGGAAVLIIGAYWFSVQVMRQGDIGFIAPFRYTGLVFALILGFVVFGDWPDALTLVGAGIVVATGLFTLYRERRVSGR
ncbi:DMT family transporter [uncultured Tateyamaria sp.]|uniref:DMT family transporter n=1 Tax=uncultured Tateyamaria sp. TaxID=455651 RepID=UPI0026110FB9|nr:DMT family transporter [uncultured Tateyamaria sp.]